MRNIQVHFRCFIVSNTLYLKQHVALPISWREHWQARCCEAFLVADVSSEGETVVAGP